MWTFEIDSFQAYCRLTGRHQPVQIQHLHGVYVETSLHMKFNVNSHESIHGRLEVLLADFSGAAWHMLKKKIFLSLPAGASLLATRKAPSMHGRRRNATVGQQTASSMLCPLRLRLRAARSGWRLRGKRRTALCLTPALHLASHWMIKSKQYVMIQQRKQSTPYRGEKRPMGAVPEEVRNCWWSEGALLPLQSSLLATYTISIEFIANQDALSAYFPSLLASVQIATFWFVKYSCSLYYLGHTK